MKIRTVEVREGEDMGPLDWSHPMAVCCYDDGDSRKAANADGMNLRDVLRDAEKHPERWEVTTYGGWPRCGWRKVIAVRMWDGHPYWSPTPSVCVESPFGGVTWESFNILSDARRVESD